MSVDSLMLATRTHRRRQSMSQGEALTRFTELDTASQAVEQLAMGLVERAHCGRDCELCCGPDRLEPHVDQDQSRRRRLASPASPTTARTPGAGTGVSAKVIVQTSMVGRVSCAQNVWSPDPSGPSYP